MTGPLDPASLLPHRPPLLLLEEVLAHDAESLHAALTIRPDTLFLEAEGVPTHIGLEYMAQACACWAGLQARQGGGQPRIGFLLGARALRLHRPWFRLGEQLDVQVRQVFRDDNIANFQGRIAIGQDLAAESDLTVYEPPEQGEPPR